MESKQGPRPAAMKKIDAVMPPAVQGQRDFGKSFGRDVCRLRCAVARPLSGAFEDSTTRSGRFLLGKTRSRGIASGARVRAASCHFHQRAFNAIHRESGQFLLLDLQHELDGRREIFQTRGSCPALSVGAGHFRANCDKPFSVPLDESRELANRASFARSFLHRPTLACRDSPGKPMTLLGRVLLLYA